MTVRLVTALAILACLQLGAIAILYWPGSEPDPGAAATTETLLPVSRDEVARIGVTNADGDSVMIVRRDGGWVIEADGLPAAASVVDRLLDALAGPAGFPVARSESARERFEVAADRFQRRITFAKHSDETYTGEDAATDTATVYLGTSPGMRRVHARRGDSAAIQAIVLSAFDVPATVDGWLQPGLLTLRDITRVRIDDHAWTRAGEGWSEDDDDRKGRVKPGSAVAGLEEALATLQVTGIAPTSTGKDAEHTAMQSVTLEQGAVTVTLRLVQATDTNESRIYSSAFDRWFTLSRYDYDRLADAIAILRDQSPE